MATLGLTVALLLPGVVGCSFVSDDVDEFGVAILAPGAAGGLCTAAGLCDPHLRCEQELCRPIPAGTPEGPCLTDDTCLEELECVDDTCVVDVGEEATEGGKAPAEGEGVDADGGEGEGEKGEGGLGDSGEGEGELGEGEGEGESGEGVEGEGEGEGEGCVAVEEICDGLDNDCDGATDEIDRPVPTSLLISFSPRTLIDPDFHHLVVTDGAGEEVGRYTATGPDGGRLEVQGHDVTFTIVTDGGTPRLGYEITEISDHLGNVLPGPYPESEHPYSADGDGPRTFRSANNLGGGVACGSDVGECSTGLTQCLARELSVVGPSARRPRSATAWTTPVTALPTRPTS